MRCSTGSPLPAMLRTFATRAQRQRPLPYSKAEIQRRKPVLTSTLGSHSGLTQPLLAAKYLRHAERVAWELGVVEDLRQFEEAAAAFPNPPKLVAATILERGNMITRDLEGWEADFLAHKAARHAALAKQYPQELIDLWTVKDRVLEKVKESSKEGKGGAAAAAAAAEKEGPAAAGSSQDAGAAAASLAEDISQASVAAPEDLDSFYESRPSVGGGGGEMDGDAARALLKTPRQSSADLIGDTRSLDRAYSQRLFLLVQGAPAPAAAPAPAVVGVAPGVWGVPAGEARAGEPLVQAAERSLRGMFGEEAGAHLQVWYPSPAPIGHALTAYPPALAAARQCYGERVFFYRAEILGGRFRLPEAGQPPRPGCPYSDYHWLTRDEAEAYLPRPAFKYLHQIVGGGAGEEAARSEQWQAKLAARGWSLARGTAARVKRVQAARVQHFTRLRAVATREQGLLAAAPWGEEGKGLALAAAAHAYHERRREQRARGLASRQALAQRPRVEAIRAALVAARQAAAGGSSAGMQQ